MAESSHHLLPSAKELLATVDNDVECRQMLWRLLQYGSSTFNNNSNDNNNSQGDATKDLSNGTTNSDRIAQVLIEALPESTVLQDALVDALWFMGLVLESGDTTVTEANTTAAMVSLIRSLASALPSLTCFWEDIMATLDVSLLEQAGLIASEKDLLKKVRMLNTQLYYRQQKYNLLQEESEGYAKLLAVLWQYPTNDAHEDEYNKSALEHQVRMLIGTFELDPNRVLDIMVDMMEAKLQERETTKDSQSTNNINTSNLLLRYLLDLMKDFSLSKLPPLLGFKMKETGTDGHPMVSNALIQVMVMLATEQLLDLRHLTPYFAIPVDGMLQEAAQFFRQQELERIKSIGRVRLGDAGGGQQQQQGDVKKNQDKKHLHDLVTQLQQHVLIRLLQALLERGEWDLAKTTLPSMQAWSDVCMLMPKPFAVLLCDLVQQWIQPVYLQCVTTPQLLAVSTVEQAPTTTTIPNDLLLPPSASLEQVLQAISEPLLCTVDTRCIAQRPLLYCQLCRLMRQLLLKQKEDSGAAAAALSDDSFLPAEAYHFLNSFLVPSLSLLSPSPSLSTELWLVLSELPYPTRYRLYRDWQMGSADKKPLCFVESDIAANKEARYHLKRLSKDNVRDMGRQLSKVTHSSPLVVFSVILSQVESYDNLIQMMVEAVRFVTPLGLDVLSYCILSRLSDNNNNNNNTTATPGVNRNRLKEDGVNVSQWLQSLESFIGAFYKKCPHVEFRGILHYLIRRLQDGNLMELGVLKTLIKDAGGYGFADYSPAASLSTTQLEGRAGSMLLKRETMSFGVVETVNSRTVEQIRSVLLSDNIGVSLLILLSQLKSRILFEPSSSPMRPKPVKLIGNLFDSCQVVVSILLEFLTSSIGDEPTSDNGKLPGFITQFAASMPSFRDLIEIFRLDVASGWLLCRPLVRLANAKKMTDGEGEEPMKDFALSESMRIAYKAVLPEATWQNISCELYEIFFSSSLYDLFCPEECYKAESDRVSKEVDRLIQRRKGAPQSSLLADTRFSKADEDELDRTKKAITILGSDLEKQKVHVAEVKRLIESKKSELFPTQKVSPTTVNTFLTHCIYPRCMQSPEDAVYCARFVSFLHSIETPGFSTLHFLDELILVLAGALYGLTEAEAANVAILLTETWRVISTWRYDKDVFEKEVAGKVGAFMVKEEMTSDDDVSQIEISFQEFESLYNKWHAAVGAAAMGCLKSAEYMHTRAGLVVLTRMVDVFPTKPRLAQSLVAALAPFQAENYPLQDIKTSAQAYGTLLVKARDEGAWKEEDAAVTKARVEKEQAAAALRKKQAEERFAEMNRESRQIMDTLGGDGRSRSRDERRRAPSRGDLGDLHKSTSVASFEPAVKGNDQNRKTEQTPPRPRSPVVENGREKDRLPRDGRERDQGDPSRRPREGEATSQRENDRDHVVGGDRGRARSDSNNPPSNRLEERPNNASDTRRKDGNVQLANSGPLRQDREEPRRWARGEQAPAQEGRNRNKRGRSPDQDDGGDEQKREEHPSKRSRVEPSTTGHPAFEPRQNAPRGGRVDSPPRRGTQALPPPTQQQQQPQQQQTQEKQQQSRGRRSRR